MASNKMVASMKSGGEEIPENVKKMLAERKKKQLTPMINPKEELEAINKGKMGAVRTAAEADSISKAYEKKWLPHIADIGYAKAKKS